jgi:hypothetical protein
VAADDAAGGGTAKVLDSIDDDLAGLNVPGREDVAQKVKNEFFRVLNHQGRKVLKFQFGTDLGNLLGKGFSMIVPPA